MVKHCLALNPWTRGTLADQIAQQLLDYVITGRLEAGYRLPSEHELVDKIEVSRPVIREVLRPLAGQHFKLA